MPCVVVGLLLDNINGVALRSLLEADAAARSGCEHSWCIIARDMLAKQMNLYWIRQSSELYSRWLISLSLSGVPSNVRVLSRLCSFRPLSTTPVYICFMAGVMQLGVGLLKALQ
jgi:hypothetical protein